MKPFRHYILTRFNLGIYDKPRGMYGRINMDPDSWMRHRMDLFSRFTLPSIMGQTCQNFTWFVFMDKATPDCWRRILESIDYPNLKLIYIHSSREWIVPRAVELMEKGDYTCITTRIDNDDALHLEAIEKLQQCCLENADRNSPWSAVFVLGCVYNIPTNEFYLCRHPTNNCATLFEPTQPFQTVMICHHNSIPTTFPTIQIEDKPYWLMVCHDQNLANNTKSTSTKKVFTEKPMSPEMLSIFNTLPVG